MFVLILFYLNLVFNQIGALPGNVDYIGLKPFSSKLDAQLIVLSPKDLTCYSTSKPNTSKICESNKCLLKAAYSNSTFVSDRYCSKDVKWFESLLYDGCLTYKNEYICMCSSNFCNGDNIQSIRGDDDCSRNPCPSGSVCLDTNKGYKCICPPWKSTCNYQKPIDCDCQNGGLCVQLQNNKYACSCKYGFTGRYCEKRDSCTPNVCENGGTCVCDRVSTIRCICRPGFSGDICQINNACLPDPNAKCSNNGVCMSDGLGGYYCKCNPNTTGKNCEQVITPTFVDVCNPNPCLNQGECTQYGSNGYICICKNDFTGTNCETQFQAKPCEENPPTVPFTMPTTNGPISINSFCSPNPCQNGGSCIDLGMQFQCICLPPFTGLFCQDSLLDPTTTHAPCFSQICDPCGPNKNPCKNGQCVNQSCIAVCDCFPGFLGQFCDQYFLESTIPVVSSTIPYTTAVVSTTPCPTVVVTSTTTTQAVTSNFVPCTTTIATSTTISSFDSTTLVTTTMTTTSSSSTTENTASSTSQITTTTTTTMTTSPIMAITTATTTTIASTTDTTTTSTTTTDSTTTSSQASTTNFLNSLNLNITLPIGNSTNDTMDISFTTPVSSSTTKSTTTTVLVISTTTTVSTNAPTTVANTTETYNTTASNLNATTVAVTMAIETTASNLNSTNSTETSTSTTSTVLVNSTTAENTTLPSTTITTTTKGCDPNTDKCCLKPCKNNGRCITTSDSYKCVCPTGFSGPNCEFLDICNTKNPCLCGTCVNDNSSSYGFKCFCPPGFTGQTCERALNCLDPGYECKNGGECVPRILGDYICSCPQPYCGLTCTNVLPNCSVNHSRFIDSFKPAAGNCSKALCNNRGTCVRKSNNSRSFSCHCSTGWIGKSCEYGLNSSYLQMLQQTNKKNLIQDQP